MTLEEAFEKYHERILKYAQMRERRDGVAEEAVGQMWLKAAQFWDNRTGTHPNSTIAWLYGILFNETAGIIRRKGFYTTDQFPKLDQEDNFRRLAYHPHKAQDARMAVETIMKRTANQLTERDHAVLNAFYYDGKDETETAAEMDLSKNNVRLVRWRALKKLAASAK